MEHRVNAGQEGGAASEMTGEKDFTTLATVIRLTFEVANSFSKHNSVQHFTNRHLHGVFEATLQPILCNTPELGLYNNPLM